jgi:hypothetical protein
MIENIQRTKTHFLNFYRLVRYRVNQKTEPPVCLVHSLGSLMIVMKSKAIPGTRRDSLIILGSPVPSLVGWCCRFAHAHQLHDWIRNMNPSYNLCNRAIIWGGPAPVVSSSTHESSAIVELGRPVHLLFKLTQKRCYEHLSRAQRSQES